ncbi:hypothetical protein RvY_09770 [Ramazzottius varieornatus]|uniref:Radial spoke head protein 9 homolog n=1 Tax=Ramazzottius varieornatus TaxID=947166 RepID=A0A1D1VAI0_RAMVA|nr:hypothetical protein RvY_09770 [Ramazzottius varieornatus]
MDSGSPLANSLSIEENLLIRAGCRILESECKQGTFRFWGKVFGTQNDYYVLQSTTIHPFQMLTTYYSRDARIWQTLPRVQPKLQKSSPRLNGMFTGDPTFTSNFVEYHYSGEHYYEPTTTAVKEEDRLSYLVFCIDNECSVVPKGSAGLDEKGFLVQNPAYEGMTYEQCRDVDSYLLYKPCSIKKTQPGYEDIGIADPAHNVLIPLSETLPAESHSLYGVWAFRDAGEEECVIMESTQWSGFFFWHNINNTNHGQVYFGRGDKNIDVPFILGSPEEAELVVDIGIVPEYDWKALPKEAIKEAEEWFVEEEARLAKLLPPLPKPKPKASPKKEGEEGEEGEDGEKTDESAADGGDTAAENTDDENNEK